MLCRVALGKSFLQFSAMKMAHSPPGHHSVIGRPSDGGLHFPEYVVYRGEQAYPEYLISYQIVKPEDSSSGAEDTTRWWIPNITGARAAVNLTGNKISQLLIITPAVKIDRNFCRRNVDETNDENNRRNNNLLRRTSAAVYSSRWCTLICDAVRCFGNNSGNSTNNNRSANICEISKTTRDKFLNNNITYKLWQNTQISSLFLMRFSFNETQEEKKCCFNDLVSVIFLF